MSSGEEPPLGSGGYYGDGPGGGGGPGLGGLPALGGLAALGGLLGMGGGPGPHPMHPQGPYGVWPTCGCSSLFIILAGILLVCGGCLRMFGQ
jgi:hypothetical protein